MAKIFFSLLLVSLMLFSFEFAGAAAAAEPAPTGEIQGALDAAGKQIQSVQEKGLVQTIWDNTAGKFFSGIAAVLSQVGQIFGQIGSLFGGAK